MNQLYFVRHGENRANLTKEFSYRKIDYSLTPKGIIQAEQTAEHFRDKNIEAIYASPLKRARETAEIIAGALQLEVIVLEELREVNVGDLDGRAPTMELWSFHNQVFTDWFSGQTDRSFPGGEDHRALVLRTRAAIMQMVAGREGERLIAVSHGGIFLAALPDICASPDAESLRRRESENCAITRLAVEQTDGGFAAEILDWARTDHLSGEAAEFVPGFLRTGSPE